MSRLAATLFTAFALLAPVSMVTAMAEPPKSPIERSISVTGSGFVVAEPDMAHISMGVVSEADNAKDALAKNSAAMRTLIDAMKGNAIEARDIQTTSFNVSPRYQNFKDGRPPVINGYQVHNQVRIVVRDIKKLGAVLDQAVQQGSNQIGGIGFEVSKADELKGEARKQAIANAKRKAELYASAAGVKLGHVLAIEEAGAQAGPRPMMGGRAAMAEAAPPIEAGGQKLEARVVVVFAVQ
jgi:hypothetical protein